MVAQAEDRTCPCRDCPTLNERRTDEVRQVYSSQHIGPDSHNTDPISDGPNYQFSLRRARADHARMGARTERVLNVMTVPRPKELRRNSVSMSPI
jgi:hypothetical protein